VRFLRLVMRSLVLLLIALFSALAAMRFAIHGGEVRVPKLVGMTVLQAQEAANGNGLTVSVEDKFYSSDIPAGEIISQAPAPDSRVRRGWRVRVGESLGSQRAAIPDLTGDTERVATMDLRERGLDLATVAGIAVPDTPPDQVVAQVPPPGASGVTSPKVSILLAQQPRPPEYVMPNFVGRQLAEAKAKIARAGLLIPTVSGASTVASVSNESQPTVASPAAEPVSVSSIPITGRIVSQSPAPGSRVTPATQIRFEVAR
jgi:eukaryotic-like serine/threonine-protein kinase